MLAYYGSKISPHMTETTNGYLICHDVPISRTGDMEYLARDLQLDGDPERRVTVRRYPEDVFDAAALASFEGKDVTSGHPPEDVTPENFAAYSKGHIENVRRRGDFMIADLHIKDANLISDIKNGVLREVSCGYLCSYKPEGDHYKQYQIRGNHVAVVPRGRAGHEVAILDAAEKAEKGRNFMSEFRKTILAAFGMAAQDATEAEMKELVETTDKALDAAPAEKAQEAKPADADTPKPEAAAEEEPESEEGAKKAPEKAVDEAPADGGLGAKLDRLIEMVGALASKDAAPAKDAIDSLIEELDADSAEVIPAGDSAMTKEARDAAVAMLKSVKPAIAAIKDAGERQRVTDALTSAVRGSGKAENPIATIMQAAQQKASAEAADARPVSNEDVQRAYDARNPHMNKEEQ